MKFVLFGRLKKTPPEDASAKGGSAAKMPQAPASNKPSVEARVSHLVSQGLAEPEIIKILKDEGYSFQEIDSGISNILKSRVSDEQAPQEGSQDQETLADDLTPILGAEDDINSPQRMQAQLTEQMDAVMEQMMEEKLSDFTAELELIDSKFEELENKIQKLAARISEFESSERKQDDKEDMEIEDLSIKETELEPRIAGLEKAFKDIIPGLVESIRELKEVVVSKKREREMEKENMNPETDNSGEFGGVRTESPAKTGNTSIFD